MVPTDPEFDPLTRVLHHSRMEALACSELSKSQVSRTPLAFGLIDVDDFRGVNSRHLIPAGDRVLEHLARVIVNCLGERDSVGRIGGDRFLVVAPQVDRDHALAMAEQIRASVQSYPFDYKGISIAVRVSVGFAVVRETAASSYDEVKVAAAASLMTAKKRGGNSCQAVYCDESSLFVGVTGEDFYTST